MQNRQRRAELLLGLVQHGRRSQSWARGDTKTRARTGSVRDLTDTKMSRAVREDVEPLRTPVPKDEVKVEKLKSSFTDKKKGERGSHANI